MTADSPVLVALLAAAALLAVGLALRLRLRLLRVLYIPAAVVAGVIGLAVAQLGTHFVAPRSANVGAAVAAVVKEWSGWPGTLIAVVFAGLLLERAQDGGIGASLRRGLRSGILAWIIILGQLVIGLIVFLAVVHPGQPAVPATFAQMLEISWAGGHGSAAGMGTLYRQQGFAEGRDIAFFCATVGLIYGVLSGLVFVNLAIRRGWTSGGKPLSVAAAIDTKASVAPIAFGSFRGEVMEPMAVTLLFLAAAVTVGLLLRVAFLYVAGKALGADDPALANQPIDYAANVPLFLFTLLGGWAVRRLSEALDIARLIDAHSVQRFVGISMEFLIVAGVATMRIESIGRFIWPLVVLMGLAAVWSTFCLLVLSRLLLPKAYWFELGLLNYGFSTANTPQGMMLLRIVDPELRSGAAADYAVAAPLSAPFIGGGVVTFLVTPLVLERVPAGVVLAALIAMIGVLVTAGLLLTRGGKPTEK